MNNYQGFMFKIATIKGDGATVASCVGLWANLPSPILVQWREIQTW